MSYYSLMKQTSSPFVMTIDTSLGNANSTFIMPDIIPETYPYIIDYGDDTVVSIISDIDPNLTHTYSIGGEYQIKIYGDLQRLFFAFENDKDKLKTVQKFGSSKWISTEDMFEGCSNFTGGWSDTPDLSECNSMFRMFRACANFNQNISDWDVSNVLIITELLYNCSSYNQETTLDISNATETSSMFFGTSSLNENVTLLNSNSVTSASRMFMYSSFNSTLVMNTSLIADFTEMFNNSSYNQSVSSFDTSSAELMTGMFRGTPFNQDISNFVTSNVTDMSYMFNGSSFNQDVAFMDISSLLNADYMLTTGGIYSTANYDAMLLAWDSKSHNNNVSLRVNSQYTIATSGTARANLVADGWIITDNGGI